MSAVKQIVGLHVPGTASHWSCKCEQQKCPRCQRAMVMGFQGPECPPCEAAVDMNGFLCCGHAWESSWCDHRCARAAGHDAATDHWCGWCGNPMTKRSSDEREIPADFIHTDGAHATRRNLTPTEAARLAPVK